jgi:glutaminyl-tRNA synthetase
MENPPKKYFRMTPGQEVRLRYAYIVRCTGVDKDENGEITAIHCTYDEQSRGGNATDGRKIKGTIHWVDANNHCEAEVRLFDRLFINESPDKVEEGHSFLENLNPDSLQTLQNCKVEKFLADSKPLDKYQFERLGYFSTDYDSSSEHLVFNRACTLKDSWSKK